MAEPARARRLTDQEGGRLLQIVRRGKHGSVRVWRAMIIMASASGTLVPAIARLVAADEDTVRDVIHTFNAKGLAALDPRRAGGHPRLISDGDIEVIVTAARTRAEKPVQPFTRWSLRKLAGYLAGPDRPVRIGRERLRQVLHERGISFQRTRTWKESTDPDRDAKLDRIEYVTSACPDRCFASGQSGPLSIRPCHGVCWAPRKRSARLRATYHRTRGIRSFHGCYCVGDDQLRGITREHKGATTPGRAEVGPGCPAGRVPAVRHHGQPGGGQDPGDPALGQARERRAVLHARERILGQSDRGAVRSGTHPCHGRPGPPESPRAGPRAAGLPALASCPRPPPRRAGRPAPRTRPPPQRTPATPGPPGT
jgi:transposase